jgi:hypothetical protein
LLQEHDTDGVAFANQTMLSCFGNFFDQLFGPQLGQVIAQRCQRILILGEMQCF